MLNFLETKSLFASFIEEGFIIDIQEIPALLVPDGQFFIGLGLIHSYLPFCSRLPRAHLQTPFNFIPPIHLLLSFTHSFFPFSLNPG